MDKLYGKNISRQNLKIPDDFNFCQIFVSNTFCDFQMGQSETDTPVMMRTFSQSNRILTDENLYDNTTNRALTEYSITSDVLSNTSDKS